MRILFIFSTWQPKQSIYANDSVSIIFVPENSKGERLTSRAFKDQCIFEFGYLVESEKRNVGGKEKRFQKKTPLTYVLAPMADNSGGNGNG